MSSHLQSAQSVQSWMVDRRRHLHRNPEVGLDLPDTHAYLHEALRDLGLEVEMHPAAGLTARIPGHSPDGTTSVLRADMDALPVTENSGVDFRSERAGAMHACGHDLHMAMLLGATRVMTERPPRRDTVIAFQPGEETDRGALRTLEHRTLDLTGPATAFALHVNAVMPPHTINYRRDTFMAYGDWFRVDFRGQGGHASQPESTGSPIDAAAHFISELHELTERLRSSEHTVATVTEVLMGNTVNVIPAEGHLRGTLRTLSAGRRDELIAGLQAVTEEAAGHAGVHGELQLHEGYPAVVNDPAYVDAAVAVLGESELGASVQEMPAPSMVIEDFAYFLHRWPGAMMYLGAHVPGHEAFNHSADVVFDEAALSTGAALLLAAADGFQD